LEKLAKKTITILLKPVAHRCNLSCTYCYYGGLDLLDEATFMSGYAYKKSLKSISSFNDNFNIKLIWHGGEPLLIGKEYFIKALQLQDVYLMASKANVSNSIQSNITLLDAEWCEILNKNQISIGFSLDGPQNIHDKNRFYSTGKGSYNDIINSILLLNKYEVEYGGLATITKNSLGRASDIINNFVNLGVFRFDFLPCFETGNYINNNRVSISADEWASFMIEAFDAWFMLDNPKIEIRYFINVVRVILGGNAGLCSLSGKCGDFFTIDHNGNIYPCDDFANDNRFIYGNVSNDSMLSVWENKQYSKFIQKRSKMIESLECHRCDIRKICNSGCTKHYELGSSLCEAKKSFFLHVINKVTTSVNQINDKKKWSK